MASKNKTPNLNLNDWAGSDAPARADFNADNRIIDLLLGGHIQNNAVHITQAERDKWNTYVDARSYFGTDATEREITIGFRPRGILIIAVNRPCVTVDFTNKLLYSYWGAAGDGNSSYAVAITDNGFIVRNTEYGAAYPPGYARMNEARVQYVYIAWK